MDSNRRLSFRSKLLTAPFKPESPPPITASSSFQATERSSPELDLSLVFSGLDIGAKESTENEKLYQETMSALEECTDRSIGNGVLTGRDYYCLAPKRWLNDEIINAFLQLLQQRDASCRTQGNSIKCHFFNTFLLPKIMTKYKYTELRRWTEIKRLKRWGQMSKTVIDCDLIFFPRHRRNHWSLILVDLRSHTISLYDSLCSSKTPEESMPIRAEAKWIVRYLVDEACERRGEDWSQQKFHLKIGHMPQQESSWDCGVFLIQCARFLSLDQSLLFSQKKMESYRVQIFNELLKGRLLEQ
eukprot:g2505.t1